MPGKLLSIVLVLALTGSARAQDEGKSALQRDSSGWTDLLSGKDLAGWKRVALAPDTKLGAKDPWKVEDGLLLCDGVGVKEMLLYDKELGDGVFHVEWRFRKVADDAEKKDYNSGVYVRTASDGKIWHQVQIAHQDKPPLLGDLFADTPVKGKIERLMIRGEGSPRAKPPGEWNTYEITAKGKSIAVWINGATTCKWDQCPLSKGPVGLQAEFFHIEFRNLKYKPLP
jgi:hypothetical protein